MSESRGLEDAQPAQGSEPPPAQTKGEPDSTHDEKPKDAHAAETETTPERSREQLELQVESLTKQLAELRSMVSDHTAQMKEIIHSKHLMDVVFNPTKLRDNHAKKDEFQLASYLSEVSYLTKPNKSGDPGLDAETYNRISSELREQDDIQLAVAGVATAMEGHYFEDPEHAKEQTLYTYTGRDERIAGGMLRYPELKMLSHHESSPDILDGQVSTWRCDERKLLIVAWRGTDSKTDMKLDLKGVFQTQPWRNVEYQGDDDDSDDDLEGVNTVSVLSDSASPLAMLPGRHTELRVGSGFLQQYLGEGLNLAVNREVADQLHSEAKNYKLLITGHSLGGALATLNSHELARTYLRTEILLITHGSPRCVNKEFSKLMARLPNIRAYRVVNGDDVVSQVPPSTVSGLRHVGHMVWLSTHKDKKTKKRVLDVKGPMRFGGTLFRHKYTRHKSAKDHTTNAYTMKCLEADYSTYDHHAHYLSKKSASRAVRDMTRQMKVKRDSSMESSVSDAQQALAASRKPKIGRETMDMLHGTFLRNRESIKRGASSGAMLLKFNSSSSDSDMLDADAAAQEAALINTLAVRRATLQGDAGVERPTAVRGVTARSAVKDGRQVKVTKVNLDELFVQKE